MQKYKLLFLDTETTGREEQDRIFQVAYKFDGQEFASLFKPPVLLSIEAMEATHYTNEDVQDKNPFQASEFYKDLEKILQDPSTVLVAHNAPFDISMLEKEGLKTQKFIDTLKVARALDPEEKLGAYRLQYLRYALGIKIDARAHDALGDVLVLEALFERLFKKIKETEKEENEAIEKMMQISKDPLEIKRFSFGKYKGEKVEDIAQKDRSYLEWLLKEKEKEVQEALRADTEDWIFTLKNYLT